MVMLIYLKCIFLLKFSFSSNATLLLVMEIAFRWGKNTNLGVRLFPRGEKNTNLVVYITSHGDASLVIFIDLNAFSLLLMLDFYFFNCRRVV